jgi:hypothetical protein
MIAAHPKPPAHPADADAKNYSAMTPQQLQIETQRLNRLYYGANSDLLQMQQAFGEMLKDLSIPIFAHLNGDTKRVKAGLDAIINKYVTATGDLH